jgi:hypothetical protein
MRSIARTVAGVVLIAAAGFGLAYLFLKKGNAAPAAEIASSSEAAAATPAPAAAAPEAPAHKHRTKHPRRGTQPVEAVDR